MNSTVRIFLASPHSFSCMQDTARYDFTVRAAVGLSLPYERTLNDEVNLNGGKEAGLQDKTDVVYVSPDISTHCRCLCLRAASLQMPTVPMRSRWPW